MMRLSVTLKDLTGYLGLIGLALGGCQSTELPDTSSSWPIETASPTEEVSAPESRPELRPVSLMPVLTATETTPPEASGEVAALAAPADQDVALHAEPSVEAGVTASARSGDGIRILAASRSSTGDVWYYGQLDTASEGWVEGKFVTFSEAYVSTSRPFVVLPGGGSVHVQPDPESETLQELEGGSVIAVEQHQDGDGSWLYTSGGWISGESLFRPACIEFNGYLPLVVVPGGTTVHSTAAYQIPVEDRLDGGELVFPFEVADNTTGTWFKTDQGWISGQSMFYPFCETVTPQVSSSQVSSAPDGADRQISSKVR